MYPLFPELKEVVMSNPPTTVRFNPTATAVHHNGSDSEGVRKVLELATGKPYTPGLEEGKYYIAFMGDVYVLDEQQYRASMGLV
jgi:hypothetical protein